MTNTYIITLFVKLAVSAAAVFCSILLWSKTRDIAWICVIASAMLSFISFIFDLLKLYGIPAEPFYEIQGIDIPLFILSISPWLLLLAAFVILLFRLRK